MLTVCCVLRQGSRGFDRAYVEKLRSMVGRHLSEPHQFVCLTDQVEAEYDLALAHDWPGWWSKLELWRPGLLDLLEGPKLYLDLDTIITGPIDWLVPREPGFWMWWLERQTKASLWCSAFMAWWGDYRCLYDEFAADPDHWMGHVYTCWPRKSDQSFISECLESRHIEIKDLGAAAPVSGISKWPETWGQSLIWFAARDKPHLVADHEFVAEHWR